MTVWFSSDHHLFHRRIRELSHRPFNSDDEMADEIIERHNSLVGADDTTYFLGDFSMGGWADSMPHIDLFNGRRILVCGNHDAPFIHRNRNSFDRVFAAYASHFDEVHLDTVEYDEFVLSHFPYDGDSHDEDRYDEYRPVDEGKILIHGHVHAESHEPQVTYSHNGTMQIHVGVDGHNYSPVSMDEIRSMVARG